LAIKVKSGTIGDDSAMVVEAKTNGDGGVVNEGRQSSAFVNLSSFGCSVSKLSRVLSERDFDSFQTLITTTLFVANFEDKSR
jgi:hypothetical protein